MNLNVHRDLKTENVMLTSDNPPVAKLIDFGLAKETRDGVGSTFNKRGTPEWMAPEQKREGVCTMTSDVYSIDLVVQFMWCVRRCLSPPVTQTPVHLPSLCLSCASVSIRCVYNHLNKCMSLTK
jgi:serine/threonine protein kinase